MSRVQLIKDLINTKKLGHELAVAGWFHHKPDQHPEKFVADTITLTEQCRWDFVKVMSSSYYMTAAYGADITYSSGPLNWQANVHRYPLSLVSDLISLPVLDQHNPILAREIDNVRQLSLHYRGKLPVLATLFNPISWVKELSSVTSHNFVFEAMINNKRALHKGLETLVETSCQLIDDFCRVGIDGIFFANQFSSSDTLSSKQYREFVKPYDEAILHYLKGKTWFNILHIHGDRNLLFDDVINYDVEALNWENTPSHVPFEQRTSIAQLRERTDKILIAGLDHNTDFYSSRLQIKDRIKYRLHHALLDNKNGAFIFAPGCGLPLNADRSHFDLLYEATLEEGLKFA